MKRPYTRRGMLAVTGQALLATALAPGCVTSRTETRYRIPDGKTRIGGAVSGEADGAKTGERILREGGNAVDAAVAAALTSCITSPGKCGIGGYGGHMVIAMPGRKLVTAIDFNTFAPAAAREDMFPLETNGSVKGRINYHGWLAAAVPGTLAGLQLALDRFGTISFAQAAHDAIAVARDGLMINAGLASTFRGSAARFRNDSGSAELYLKNGEPLRAGEPLRNPALAEMLSTLARRNSVDSFYRGDIARQIADGFRRNGGLVTAQDMAAYRAREVQPNRLDWNGFTIYTAPLTAGGISILEMLSILKALNWSALTDSSIATHAQIEAARVAWKNRLELFGDPEQVKVPVDRLLSPAHAHEYAGRINAVLRKRRPLAIEVDLLMPDGTTHLSVADANGNLVALTLTHGSSFGAQVTVAGIGLTLGHGMSRFNPRPGHPNSPGGRKRPLDNMCPTIVLRERRPVLAVGGAGGVKIPNSIAQVLTQYVARNASMEAAIAAPRFQTMGTLELGLERAWPRAEADYLQRIGFTVRNAGGAFVSAASFNVETGECRVAAR